MRRIWRKSKLCKLCKASNSLLKQLESLTRLLYLLCKCFGIAFFLSPKNANMLPRWHLRGTATLINLCSSTFIEKLRAVMFVLFITISMHVRLYVNIIDIPSEIIDYFLFTFYKDKELLSKRS